MDSAEHLPDGTRADDNADVQEAEVLAFESPEAAELDRLYQQALDAMEEIATDLDSASTLLTDDESEDAEATVFAFSTEQEPDVAEQDESVDFEGRGVARVSADQIIEAALFVGGEPLTSKEFARLLHSDCGEESIDRSVERLNSRYQSENRPYLIQLGEGGYRLELREDFEGVRDRVYGLGPKEIKLSQEALELLSLIAYRQPLTREEIETLSEKNAGGILRQLARRELIESGRIDDCDDDVYRTTPRFLEVFGLGHLDDLPRAEDLNFK